MNILCCGAAGFIGNWTTIALTCAGHHVTYLDNMDEKIHGNTILDPIYPTALYNVIIGDIRDETIMFKALQDIDIVYNFAAYQDYLPDYSKFIDVNVTGTALLYEVIRKYNLPIKQVIIASSQAVYGESKYFCPNLEPRCDKIEFYTPPPRKVENKEWNFYCPICNSVLKSHNFVESDNLKPTSVYGLSKMFQEQVASKLSALTNVPTTILRYSIVQGAGQLFYNAYSGACRNFCIAYKSGKAPLVYEDGMQRRDYTNIHDIVDANLIVLNNPDSFNRVFNVSSGVAYTTLEFANIVKQIAGSNVEPELTELYRVGDVRDAVSSNFNLTKLGWYPQHSITESVEEYWKWLSNQHNLYQYVDEAFNVMQESKVLL
jgi:dTDP-L-rhamnose 4-epimerase